MADEKRISQLMATLNCSREEALDVLRADAEIDGGKRVEFDLSPEEEKRAKKYANVDTHKRPANPVHRERKPDEDKRYLIEALEEMLQNSEVQAENLIITNPERQIDFVFHNKRYRVVLSAPRK